MALDHLTRITSSLAHISIRCSVVRSRSKCVSFHLLVCCECFFVLTFKSSRAVLKNFEIMSNGAMEEKQQVGAEVLEDDGIKVDGLVIRKMPRFVSMSHVNVDTNSQTLYTVRRTTELNAR